MYFIVGLYEEHNHHYKRPGGYHAVWVLRGGPFRKVEAAELGRRLNEGAGSLIMGGERYDLVDSHICKAKDLHSYGLSRRARYWAQYILPGLEGVK